MRHRLRLGSWPDPARPRPLLTGSRRLAHYTRPYTHNLTSRQGPLFAHLVTPGLARGLRTPRPFSCCLRHTSRARLPLQAAPRCVPHPGLLRHSLLWARPPGHLGNSSRIGLRSWLKAHKLGHGSGSWPGPACSRSGLGCPLPSPPPSPYFVCLSSVPSALPPSSSLPLLLCSVSPVSPCFAARPQAFSRALCLGPGPPSPAHAHTSTARSRIRAQPASLKCAHIFALLDLTIPQLVCAARGTIAAGRGIVLMASDC